MQILLYSGFRKRENSTKIPLTTDASRTVTGYLREPCSIMNPVFKIERFPSNATPQSFNYAFVGEFSRWYFVTDWSWEDGLWQCTMTVDVLGSFKTDIGNSQAYIERCSTDFNGAVVDTWYPTTTDFLTASVPLASSWNGVAPSGGCYVLGVICSAERVTSQIGGAVTYYVMTPGQLASLMHYLLGSGFLDDNGFPQTMTPLQQLSQDTVKAFINPVQYIVSCTWFPLNATDLGDGYNHDIVIGYFDVDTNHASGQYLRKHAFTLNVTGELPVHPQAATRGKYLNYAPYTRMTLEIPPFGSIPLDTSFCEIGAYLHCTIWCDPVTGKATLHVQTDPESTTPGTGAIIRETSAMFGIPIQLSQITPDYLGAMTSILQLGSSMDMGFRGDISEGMMAVRGSSSIGNALHAIMPQVTAKGATGSFLSTVIPPQLTAQYFILTDEDRAEFGRPLCEIRTINTLSGFILCKDAHADFPCYKDEKSQILKYMTSGFFWE